MRWETRDFPEPHTNRVARVEECGTHIGPKVWELISVDTDDVRVKRNGQTVEATERMLLPTQSATVRKRGAGNPRSLDTTDDLPSHLGDAELGSQIADDVDAWRGIGLDGELVLPAGQTRAYERREGPRQQIPHGLGESPSRAADSDD